MLSALKQKIAEGLPEPAVLNLVQLRHGEKPWQVAVKSRARVALDRPPLDESAGRRGLRAKVVTEFDVHAEREENHRAVAEAFDRAGVRYVAVPGARGTARCFAVSAEDRDKANAALLATLTEPCWGVHRMVGETPGVVTLLAGIHRLDEKGLRAVEGAAAIEVFRLIAAPTGRTLCGAEQACVVDFWPRQSSAKVARPDGGRYEVGTRVARRRNGYVDYLSPAAWEEATGSPTHWPASASLPLYTDVRDPIDVVYTWVDGDDPAWMARKAAYTDDALAAELNSSAAHSSRYVSRDELRYSLRSVAMYANWVRRIYIVTDQQIPSWLNTAHPKIQVVDHKEIFADASALPVFNSHAIESQLHHIDGLSERYLYLNDDVFFGRAVEPELFFHSNGLAKFFLSKTPLDIDPPSSRDLPVLSAAKHNRELIEQQFGVTITNKFKHCPIPQLRSVLVELEERYPQMFDQVSRSRFRHPDDLSITSALHHYYAYCRGLSVPAPIRYVYQDIARADTPRRLVNLLRERDTDVFCLNDHESPKSDRLAQQRILAEFLRAQFPVASPFELSE